MSTFVPDDHTSSPSLQDRLKMIQERIAAAAAKSGRPAEAVRLVAAAKTVPADSVLELVSFGVTDIAENRVQEAEAKRPTLSSKVLTHHFIGHLQTNKARKAVDLFDLIQTVDRPELAEVLDRRASELDKKQRCLIEIKISPEPTKTGIPLAEAASFVESFRRYAHLELDGFMTIAPYGLRTEDTRDYFRTFVNFSRNQKSLLASKTILSFGMTDDFEIAVEEGSTMVRIGRALFGERPKPTG